VSTRTVLVFRIGSLGDTIVALPCFHHIARAFANFRRVLITDVAGSPKAASVDKILAGSRLIDDVIDFPPPPRRVRELLTLRTRIRETRAHMLVYVADRDAVATLRDVLFFRLCGIRHVIGAPLARALRQARIDPETGHEEHEAERLVRCLSSLGAVDLEDRAVWDLRLRAGERRAAEVALAPLAGRGFIAVSVGGKSTRKDWGDANWRELLSLLAAEWPDLGLVFFGASEEFDRSAGLSTAWTGKALNFCGCLTPRESAAAIEHAMLYTTTVQCTSPPPRVCHVWQCSEILIYRNAGTRWVGVTELFTICAAFGPSRRERSMPQRPRRSPRRRHTFQSLFRVSRESRLLSRRKIREKSGSAPDL
jgi:heptosyltransferase III